MTAADAGRPADETRPAEDAEDAARHERARLTRRGLFAGGAGLVLGAAGAGAVAASLRPAPVASDAGDAAGAAAEPVAAHGPHQAGIAHPPIPQAYALVSVFDSAAATTADLRAVLATLGDEISRLTGGGPSDLAPDGPGDLTVAIGIGPRLLGRIDPAHAALAELPAFAGDAALPARVVAGDVLVIAAAADANLLENAIAAIAAAAGLEPRWQQPGFRGPLLGVAARNPLGYHDGVIVPRTAEELDAGVWIGDGPFAGGTVCVARRLRLDLAAFRSLDPAAQDAAIGRRKSDGAPLSGGEPADEVDLLAKTPEGAYLVPARAHARAAHPSFTGSPLMMRRSYSYANADDDRGLMFLSFQSDVGTFVRTQQRLDETDDLMAFATTTASGAFVMLPGFTPSSPLGARLGA